jgi:hypothetical protein
MPITGKLAPWALVAAGFSRAAFAGGLGDGSGDSLSRDYDSESSSKKTLWTVQSH